MRVTCGNCQAGYTVPDDKLSAGRRLQFNCRHCGERVVVEPIVAKRPASGAIAPTAASREPRWFVAGADGSYQKLAESEARSLIEAGALSGETLVWRKGFGEWAPASQTEPWASLLIERQRMAQPPAAQPQPPAARAPQPQVASAHAAAPRPATQQPASPRQSSVRAGVAPVAVAPHAAAPHAIAPHAIAPAASAVPAGTAPDIGEPMSRAEAGAASPRPDASLGRRRRRITDRGLAAPSAGANAGEAGDEVAGRSVVGMTAQRGAQRAVSLPIVRPSRGPSGSHMAQVSQASQAGQAGPANRANPANHGRSAQRFSPSAQAHGTPMDANQADDGTAWAPATDTYIGPRDRFTRRLGSELEREALLGQVDRETKLRRDLRRWQWVALGTACIATLAFSLAIFALMNQRDAEQVAAACTAPVEVQPEAHSSGSASGQLPGALDRAADPPAPAVPGADDPAAPSDPLSD